MKFGEKLAQDSGVCGLDEEELKLFHYNPEKNVLLLVLNFKEMLGGIVEKIPII